MRYPASEKLEIIRLVEQSHLPVRPTLDRLGIPRSTFYVWYDKYQPGGIDALQDKVPKPTRVWNRISDDIRQQVIDLALTDPQRLDLRGKLQAVDRKLRQVSVCLTSPPKVSKSA